jgi:HK97 family phage major capsid protein
MNKILELREKRAQLWENTKSFLDSKRNETGILSAEDTVQYEKMEADVVNLGKEIDRLERQANIDMELSKVTSNPLKNTPNATMAEEKTGRASDAYHHAFWKSMRNKTNYDVQNALQIGTDAEGGYLAPDEFERTLIESLQDVNIIRSLANVISTGSGERQIPVVATKGTASWVAEEGVIPESDDSYGLVTLNAHKLATIIKVSDELLNDSVFNLERYIAREFGRRIGTAEEIAFVNGNGTSKPTGLMGSGSVGVTANSSNAIVMDEIIDLYHSLREPYRRNAVWLTHDATIKAIRKLKDGGGQYLWQPSVQVGQPDTILNRPVRTSTALPTLDAGAKIIAFGDFSYYWIADRQGRTFQRLNELFAVTGQVGFRATQRVDGKLILPEAIKILQMKA